MVLEKQNKIKETLKLMSLSKFNYAISYWINQSLLAVFASIITSVFIWGNETWFPSDTQTSSVLFLLSNILYAFANVS